MRHLLTSLLLVTLAGPVSIAVRAEAPRKGAPSSVTAVDGLLAAARARVGAEARVPLAAVPAGLDAARRLHGPDAPNYLRAMGAVPEAVVPLADLVHAVFYRGGLPGEVKAAMGLRIAQVNASPYVAAHAVRVLRSSERGMTLQQAVATGGEARLPAADRLAIEYGEQLTRDVNGVTDDRFEALRGAYTDSEIVELTIVTAFFNYFSRYAEALRLPVEPWALAEPAPAPPSLAGRARPRVALLANEEIEAAAASLAASKEVAARQTGLGLGMANSQRAMLRAPALALPWRAYGTAVRTKEEVGRDIKLQVSLAVSMMNGCRYCTIHQILGLRRLGVEAARLVALKKDDGQLTPKERVAVTFARRLTERPGGTTDADYRVLRETFGERGAFEVMLQASHFAFMNRFTDGLRLPSEDEAVRVYQETYGTAASH